jgi:Chaperone of endosialidase
MTSAGTFSIGNTNTTYNLDVTGTGRFTGALTGTTATFTAGTFNPSFIAIGNSVGNGQIQLSNSANYKIGAGTDYGGMAITVGGSDRIYILNDGKVGIGTSSPSYILDVQYGGNISQRIRNNAAGGTATLLLETANTFSGTSQAYVQCIGSSGGGQSQLVFATAGASGDSTATERMRITSGGNVLIGTTTDNGSKLNVNGSISASNSINSTGSSAILYFQNRPSSNNFGWYGNTNVLLYNTDVGNIASIAYNTGVYTPLSDINKKKDFEESTIGLNAILSLKPTLYRMKSDETNGNKELGFIAQEVKEFIPQAYVESDEFIGLNYNAIVAALVKSVQELKAEIDELKNK